MMMRLEQLTAQLRTHAGVRSKAIIRDIAHTLGAASRSAWVAHGRDILNGDDAAAIPDGEGFLLFAAEGLLPDLVRDDPWFAGFCSIMVNISDIAAMGGVPYAVTDVLFAGDGVDNQRLLEGMLDASSAFGVPVVGGHTSNAAQQTCLSVAIVGRAQRLLSSFESKPGQAIVCAIDLRGAYRGRFNNFNAATSATSEQLRRNVSLLSQAANLGLATAAKDISQAGLVGTLTMLCESSQVGATLNLELIPKPKNVDDFRWLTTFPSYGYLLTCATEQAPDLIRHFQAEGITAARVGEVNVGGEVVLRRAGQSAMFWNVLQAPLTGMVVAQKLSPVPAKQGSDSTELGHGSQLRTRRAS